MEGEEGFRQQRTAYLTYMYIVAFKHPTVGIKMPLGNGSPSTQEKHLHMLFSNNFKEKKNVSNDWHHLWEMNQWRNIVF